jgi:heme A synthase
VVHWLLAAMTVAALAATAMRAGALGASAAGAQPASARTARGAAAAVGLALATVVMGGLTAKVPGANSACIGFPWCRIAVATHGGALHIQLTHRVLAFLLFFHVLGVAWGVTRREEAPAIRRAAVAAAALVVLQVIVAAAMVEVRLPPEPSAVQLAPGLRSLHQAVGLGIWLSVFTLAYLARLGPGAARSRASLPWGAPPELHDRPTSRAAHHRPIADHIESRPIASPAESQVQVLASGFSTHPSPERGRAPRGGES